jgi:hypothetical protein
MIAESGFLRESTIHFRIIETCEGLESGTCEALESGICEEPGTCEILEFGICKDRELQ